MIKIILIIKNNILNLLFKNSIFHSADTHVLILKVVHFMAAPDPNMMIQLIVHLKMINMAHSMVHLMVHPTIIMDHVAQ